MGDSSELDEARRRAVESFVTDWLSEYRIPGASVALVEANEPVLVEGFGARDLDSNAPATPETRYGVASVTKSFSALAVLQFVEKGEVALSDPVSTHLPFFEELTDPPTIRDLLTHSSRMPSDGASVALISRAIGADPVEVPLTSERDLERYVREAHPEQSPTQRFFYYNTGYTVLGTLVSELDGREFPTYVEEEILEPIGMNRSVVAPSDFDALDNTMTPYRTKDGERVEAGFPVKGVGAAGGLVSTAEDLAAYLRFQLDPDPAVIEPDVLASAREPHVTRQRYIDGSEQSYGYGWMRRPFLDEELVEHGGALAVSTTYVGFLPESGMGVAIACNDSPEAHPTHVGRALLAILQDEDPTGATEFFGLRAKTENVVGGYESYQGIQQATVEADGAALEIEFENALEEETIHAFPETADPDDLQYYHVDASGVRVPLTFELTEEGMDLYYRRWRLHRT